MLPYPDKRAFQLRSAPDNPQEEKVYMWLKWYATGDEGGGGGGIGFHWTDKKVT